MNQNVYTVYISNRQAQINTMDIILTIPIYNALPYTYIYTFAKHQKNVN